MEPEIITKRMVGECSSSVTDSSVLQCCLDFKTLSSDKNLKYQLYSMMQ